MNAPLLREARCYFAGGTAIAMQLGEFRESVDIDFLCADAEGYRRLRSSIFEYRLEEIFPAGIEILREARADRDGIRAVLTCDGMPIKFEIVREARITLTGDDNTGLAVPCLARDDLFAEKLLANADRFADKSTMSRDIIDLIVMQIHWGEIPRLAMQKAESAYGLSIAGALNKAIDMLRANPVHLAECVVRMDINDATANQIRLFLANARKHPR